MARVAAAPLPLSGNKPVELDFDAGRAVVADLLEASGSESVDRNTFLETAAALGDDPGDGDGLTELERHPPTYVADPRGQVERLDG